MTQASDTRTPTSAELFERAQRVIPSGVNSPVRAFGSVGGTPPFIVSASGALLRDADGREYVDMVGSWGPMILGHANPAVVEAVQEAAGKGLSFGAPQPGEVLLAEEVVSRVRPVERVRMVNSGTEAVMSALRVARAATCRDVVVKFAGNYHGHVDALLAEAGSGLATFALPGSAGVTASTAKDTVVLPYGDRGALRELFTQRGQEIAAVIVEAAPCNMGVVPPPVEDGIGFNRFLHDLTREHGALLISDEVLTGFRAGPEGQYGLDGEGWAPDLMTFGKVIGGGLPVGAFGGRADLMDLLAPAGPVYQAGTLSGNPLATAAGLATLAGLDEAAYAAVCRASAAVQDAVSTALSEASVPHTVQSTGTLFSVFFRDEPVVSYDDAKGQDTEAFTRFFHSLLEQGVHLPPSAFEAWFVSTAHTDQVLDRLIDALPVAASAAAGGAAGS